MEKISSRNPSLKIPSRNPSLKIPKCVWLYMLSLCAAACVSKAFKEYIDTVWPTKTTDLQLLNHIPTITCLKITRPFDVITTVDFSGTCIKKFNTNFLKSIFSPNTFEGGIFSEHHKFEPHWHKRLINFAAQFNAVRFIL